MSICFAVHKIQLHPVYWPFAGAFYWTTLQEFGQTLTMTYSKFLHFQ